MTKANMIGSIIYALLAACTVLVLETVHITIDTWQFWCIIVGLLIARITGLFEGSMLK